MKTPTPDTNHGDTNHGPNLKIIQLIQKPQRRGAEIFAAQLSGQLQALGHEVLLVSIFPGDAALPFQGDWRRLNRPVSARLFDIQGWWEFARLVRDWTPDLIQANAADTLKFSVFSRILFRWNTPIIYRNANQMGDFIRGPFHRIFNQFLIGSLRGVVSVSQASRKDFHRSFRFPGHSSQVVPIGIVPEEVEELLRQGDSQQELPSRYLIQVGGLVSEKDPLGMLEIFREIHAADPGLHQVFLGSGPLEPLLKEKAESAGLGSRVLVIPNQSNIFPYLSRAQALVMPSRIEGLPGVVLEAMYCRVPVVAYGVGGIPEILVSGETGWCVKPNDGTAFSQAVLEITTMPPAQKSIILEQAHAKTTQRFTLVQIASQFEDFYREIGDGKKGMG